MKVLIISCLLAVASAGLVPSSQFHVQDVLGGYSYGYAGGPSAKQESRSADGVTHGGYSYVDGNGHLQSVNYVADDVHGFRVAATNLPQAPVAHLAAPVALASVHAPVAHYAAPYVHGQHIPIIGHNGVPLETPEVVAAKAAHFAAHAEASARHGHVHYRKRRGLYHGVHIPLIDHNGFQVDTPEVQHAKAHHFAAHADAQARNHHVPVVAYAPAYAQHIPVIGHNGVPLDTPEVAAAKAHHYAAHAEAAARDHHVVPVAHYAPVYAGHHAYAQHIPVLDHNGFQVDTPEVQHAKAHHFAAHAEANARGAYGAYGAHGAHPVDTPEVQIAKAHHFAAHADAQARNHGW